jgi:hypothetical protein
MRSPDCWAPGPIDVGSKTVPFGSIVLTIGTFDDSMRLCCVCKRQVAVFRKEIPVEYFEKDFSCERGFVRHPWNSFSVSKGSSAS